MSDFSHFLEKARLANVIPVVETMPADLLTPLSVYLKLSANSKNSFLLESVEGGTSLARYSFIGADPETIYEATNSVWSHRQPARNMSRSALSISTKTFFRTKGRDRS